MFSGKVYWSTLELICIKCWNDDHGLCYYLNKHKLACIVSDARFLLKLIRKGFQVRHKRSHPKVAKKTRNSHYGHSCEVHLKPLFHLRMQQKSNYNRVRTYEQEEI
ncbi:hypothetical protein M9H77_02091 [Catharanthus roseus]|uniref:Uncharacterized protein n=1 Tax=Catharanthus roseus TaxID=4058 RepID=A0ACC0C7U3_CATRO|nr:hypothetical protein M9H77_02091 [Catharanthus roseus]